MLCSHPYQLAQGIVPCGRCPACCINKRREMTGRLLLQHAGHRGASAFLTLTYSEGKVPREDGTAVLCANDMRGFIQRLRRAVGVLRYAYVGEYGERTMRPHYHVLLWVDVPWVDEGVYRTAWSGGFVDVGEITESSIAYTISYVLKRLTKEGHEKLEGRPPEFGRYSQGLGVSALAEFRRCARANSDGVLQLPREFRLNGKRWPVPKYLRLKLEGEGYVFRAKESEEMEEAFVSSVRESEVVSPQDLVTAFRRGVKAEVEGRRSRSRIRLSRGVIGRKKHETL